MRNLLKYNQYENDDIMNESVKHSNKYAHGLFNKLKDNIDDVIPLGEFKNRMEQFTTKVEFKNIIYEVTKSKIGYSLKINNLSKFRIDKKIGNILFELFTNVNK